MMEWVSIDATRIQLIDVVVVVVVVVAAVLATIREREPAGDWIKFTMNVQTIFKKTRDNRVRRGMTYFWVRMADLACKCPKIKINK